MNRDVKVIVSIDCKGPAFVGKDGRSRPEEGVADVLLDIVAQIRSGTKVLDLNAQRVRVWTGEEVAVIIVATPEASVK